MKLINFLKTLDQIITNGIRLTQIQETIAEANSGIDKIRYPYSVRFYEDDNTYRIMLIWAINHRIDPNYKATSIRTNWVTKPVFIEGYSLYVPELHTGDKKGVHVTYGPAEDSKFKFQFDDVVGLMLNDSNKKEQESSNSYDSREKILHFYFKNIEDCKKFYEKVKVEALNLNDVWQKDSNVFLSNSNGDWMRKWHIGKRNFDSVILKENQKESISNDLNKFMSSEKDYENLGLPYRRGYLFHGPPGTGKTSFIKALADYHNLDIYCTSIPKPGDKTSILDLLSNIDNKYSVVLIEDIDTMELTHDRDKVGPQKQDLVFVTLSEILNALDGIATPHGLIIFMTTNKLESLDPALTRPGRIDVLEHFDYIDDYQLEEMMKLYYPNYCEPVPSVENCEIMPASISEICKTNLMDAQAAYDDLLKLINSKTLNLKGTENAITVSDKKWAAQSASSV